MFFLYVSRDVAICPSSNVLNKYSSKGIAAGFPDQKGRCIGLESIKPAAPSLPFLDMGRYEDYFKLEFMNKGKKKILVMYSEDTEATEAIASLFGYFCIITSDRMTAKEALLLYKPRDSSEKLFSADKTFTRSRAERVQTEQSLRSKVFIEFITLSKKSKSTEKAEDDGLFQPSSPAWSCSSLPSP